MVVKRLVVVASESDDNNSEWLSKVKRHKFLCAGGVFVFFLLCGKDRRSCCIGSKCTFR